MEYLSANEYIRKKFGEKLYRISLDGGMTCPTRDGTLGTRGCIFCSACGSGEFGESAVLSIDEAFERGKARVAAKSKSDRYIAYFQSFTNTYAPVDYLRRLYTKVINRPDVAVLSIATRPDCLPPDVTALLGELNKIKPVWVELGLQTTNEKTAEYIRRGYKNEVFFDAVKRLHAAGIEVIAHVIVGLPGENISDMLRTVRALGEAKTDGVKLQLLHVCEGTDLAEDYKKGMFETLTLDEYAKIIPQLIAALPEDTVIHRITGDGDKKILIAPLWSADKKRVLNTLKKATAEYER